MNIFSTVGDMLQTLAIDFNNKIKDSILIIKQA